LSGGGDENSKTIATAEFVLLTHLASRRPVDDPIQPAEQPLEHAADATPHSRIGHACSPLMPTTRGPAPATIMGYGFHRTAPIRHGPVINCSEGPIAGWRDDREESRSPARPEPFAIIHISQLRILTG
jgi:hypothetical protein